MAIVVLAMLLALVLPSPAASEGEVVIRGSASSSHLRLTVEGGAIRVSGRLARDGQAGCRFTRRYSEAVCPLAGASRVEVDMGPDDDEVEVLDRLPLPLTAYLGRGSDKLIGNGERDTCYSQGSRRNRCIGGGGDDVCITGRRNSDCVGQGGDDYCRHGAGSDGCWGGPGDDVCVMGAGMDGCHGEAGNDRLYGGPDPDQLYGGAGRDHCDGGRGVGRSHGCERGPGH
jgi:Ca2+-binding RTX toxin-like protein